MLGLKEICFIFGYFVALTTPRPLDHGNKSCVSKLQKRAKELCETYKEGTKVNKSVVKEIHKTIAAVLPNKLPDCSQNKHTDLDFIVAYNTLFISIANHSHTSLKDPVETKLLTVIGQQSVCLSNHRKSETNNLTIDFNPPPLSEIVHLKLIYYHLFESFKTCMDQLSRTTV